MTEPTVAESLLLKIRALLAKAESTDSPAEAQALTGKAADLMAKYGIERAMLADVAPQDDPIGGREIFIPAPYARDKREILMRIAQALGCKFILRQKGNRIFGVPFGYDSDIERIEMLFTSVLVQAAHELAVTEVPWREDPKAFRRSWYQGYAIAIGARLREAEARARNRAEAEQQTTAGGRSAALVLVDRATKLERAYEDQFAGIKKARTRQLSGGGRRAGYQAGQRADLGGHKVTRSNRKELGR
ncbi:DUF2786 domain-containing protein [Actinomadura sp. 21ATH]|uniref:DUF2786 domain-containing protein n=1 Tax=Actinomadura sp. 21ATH TaxID=1735444 RepID=UPI0035C10113